MNKIIEAVLFGVVVQLALQDAVVGFFAIGFGVIAVECRALFAG